MAQDSFQSIVQSMLTVPTDNKNLRKAPIEHLALI